MRYPTYPGAVQDQVVWNGENGTTIFFQCELPYDVSSSTWTAPGYVGYRIGDKVKKHTLSGAGVYSYFRDYEVFATSGFRAPEARGEMKLTNLFTVFLNGKG